jgi:hypothetical protein
VENQSRLLSLPIPMLRGSQHQESGSEKSLPTAKVCFVTCIPSFLSRTGLGDTIYNGYMEISLRVCGCPKLYTFINNIKVLMLYRSHGWRSCRASIHGLRQVGRPPTTIRSVLRFYGRLDLLVFRDFERYHHWCKTHCLFI